MERRSSYKIKLESFKILRLLFSRLEISMILLELKIEYQKWNLELFMLYFKWNLFFELPR